VVGDLLEPADVSRVVSGCRRVYFFGLSVSAGYLEATVTMAAVAREVGVDALVNMSQMTVSQMSIQHTTPSRQQRQHWLGEQALAWSGLPVVTIRPTMFLESFVPLAGPAVRDRGRIELPFGRGKTNWEFDAAAKRLPDEVINYYVRMLSNPESLRGSFGWYRALDTTIAQDEQRKTRRLTMPVLAIGGAASFGEHVANAVRVVADDVQSVVIPGTGHFVAEEAPEEMLATLTAFLAPYRDGG
jgi:pimeloyl-ACP methyl ester carboxylesterase